MIRSFRWLFSFGILVLASLSTYASFGDQIDSHNNYFQASESYFSHPENYVKINEIYPRPLSGQKEQIELYNPTAYSASLSQCALFDGANHLIDISSYSVPANGFLVLTLNYSVLNNSGDMLFYVCHNKTQDQVTWGNWDDGNLSDNAPNPSSGKSIGRYPDGKDTNVDKTDFSVMDLSMGSANHL